jgi:hypothetical protein
LWTIPSMSMKMMSMLLTLIFNCLAFFGLGEFGLSMYGSCSLPRTLVYLLPRSLSHFSEICTKFDAHLLLLCGPFAQLHQAKCTTPNGAQKTSAPTQVFETLHSDSQDMLVLSFTVVSYYICCTHSSISPRNYGYSLVITLNLPLL